MVDGEDGAMGQLGEEGGGSGSRKEGGRPRPAWRKARGEEGAKKGEASVWRNGRVDLASKLSGSRLGPRRRL